MGIAPLDEEDEKETEEPLQPRAPRLELDIFLAPVVRYPDAEVITVGCETEPVVPLLPPVAEGLRQFGICGAEKNVALLRALESVVNRRGRRNGLGGNDVRPSPKREDLFWAEPHVLEQHLERPNLACVLWTEAVPLHILNDVGEVDLGVEVPIVRVVDEHR